MFSLFNSLVVRHQCYRVKSTGPLYLACAGCPEPSDVHALQAADLALDLLLAAEAAREELDVPQLRLRVGVHSGALVGGVIRAANNHRFDSKEAGGQSNSCRVPRHLFSPDSHHRPPAPRFPNTHFRQSWAIR